MNLKKILGILVLIIWFFGFWVVYSNYIKTYDAKIVWILSKKIYLDSSNLNSTVIALSSQDDISKNVFSWFCDSTTNFLYEKENIYFFSLLIKDKNCTNWNFYFLDNKSQKIAWTLIKFDLLSNYKIYDKFLDYKTAYLEKTLKDYKSVLEKLSDYKTYQVLNINLDVVKNSRLYAEANYNNNVIENILQKRKQKYSIPVEGFLLPTKKTKLPNSSRPYRAGYTDWIHNWWDIDAKYWTPVQSIDDAVVVKIVNGFKFSDISKVNMWENLSYEDKIKNLDILRWNQIWLKTMKWDVIFYAHLSKLDENLKVWDFVTNKQYLWNVWKTWVPDENYTDYHLHFELKKNPWIVSQAWNNTMLDYMKWDRYFKWQTDKYIVEHQYDIFQK